MTPESYGAGPHMCAILVEFWGWKEVITRKNGYHGPHFQETRRTTYGGLISPNLFNMVVNNVVHNWLSMTVEDKLVAHDGL